MTALLFYGCLFVAFSPSIVFFTMVISRNSQLVIMAIAIGTGSGITYGFVMYGTILWEAQGPGNLFSPACPTVSLFILSAIYALCFSLLHIAWNITAFQGYRTKNYFNVGVVLLSHFAASYFIEAAMVPTVIGYTFRTMIKGDSITKIT
ncbi:gamma-secretase subunit Aph-1 [Heterostelium album PN500]|uniref:Gamma-secretase subunit Aph-1 n=1 Tax=Heterostelium pallidum (strain ATCC 26659 / Pp 5 / PN500) TaxID=670386 RepID=D3AXL8_HETP5|nr:gamma-secretase subunit Aph-1 [Heterostelium album PN500]EFA85695.1 gamma-secretase subunit Aph-1 [Heterostelium album PN500]|eukprot:XP_020437801.1 gamma-secretase subunit Aph-1 [Heterostelium album PN500]